MQSETGLPAGLLLGFLLVFTRMAGIFLLIPIPGVRTGPDTVRVIAALSLTIGVVSRWPAVELNEWTVTALLPLIMAEFVLGQAIGLAASVLAEAFLMAAQIISLQAGFSYASMIDPTTQNESTSLAVLAQLTAGMLFFAAGLDREVVRTLIASLEVFPVGKFVVTGELVRQTTSLFGTIFSTGVRLALPAVVLLLLVDVAFGLLSRLRVQLQVVSFLFTAKLLASLAALAYLAAVFPDTCRELSARVLEALKVFGA